jgi:hypothetical protein
VRDGVIGRAGGGRRGEGQSARRTGQRQHLPAGQPTPRHRTSSRPRRV